MPSMPASAGGEGYGAETKRDEAVSIRKTSICRMPSISNILRKASTGAALTISDLNMLKQSINMHNDTVAKNLPSSKDSVERRKEFEIAFRECKEAFLVISTVLAHLLEEKTVKNEETLAVTVKKAVT